ncbi:hypothetical protein B0H14DRAFT_2564384 [Mycena olivaceomarginata]|nr:hypothetical protein B0H14DRAFT_2564384 [Mycena olivaceomarginata]
MFSRFATVPIFYPTWLVWRPRFLAWAKNFSHCTRSLLINLRRFFPSKIQQDSIARKHKLSIHWKVGQIRHCRRIDQCQLYLFESGPEIEIMEPKSNHGLDSVFDILILANQHGAGQHPKCLRDLFQVPLRDWGLRHISSSTANAVTEFRQFEQLLDGNDGAMLIHEVNGKYQGMDGKDSDISIMLRVTLALDAKYVRIRYLPPWEPLAMQRMPRLNTSPFQWSLMSRRIYAVLLAPLKGLVVLKYVVGASVVLRDPASFQTVAVEFFNQTNDPMLSRAVWGHGRFTRDESTPFLYSGFKVEE